MFVLGLAFHLTKHPGWGPPGNSLPRRSHSFLCLAYSWCICYFVTYLRILQSVAQQCSWLSGTQRDSIVSKMSSCVSGASIVCVVTIPAVITPTRGWYYKNCALVMWRWTIVVMYNMSAGKSPSELPISPPLVTSNSYYYYIIWVFWAMSPVFAAWYVNLLLIQEAQLSLANRPTLLHADAVLSRTTLWWMTAIYWPDILTFAYPLSFDALSEGDSLELSGSYLVWEN